jgi:hypothetical protein
LANENKKHNKHDDECGCGEEHEESCGCGEEHEESCGCGEEHEETTEQLVAETNFMLHVLIDFLIEKEIISKVEFEDKLDAVESELFADEAEVGKDKKTK